MTLREFIYARTRDAVDRAAADLNRAQLLGPEGLYLYPNAHLVYRAAEQGEHVTRWLIERRLYGVPRSARVQTMKALAYGWRDHPDYDPAWSPA